jgi:hypothetical protein
MRLLNMNTSSLRSSHMAVMREPCTHSLCGIAPPFHACRPVTLPVSTSFPTSTPFDVRI